MAWYKVSFLHSPLQHHKVGFGQPMHDARKMGPVDDFHGSHQGFADVGKGVLVTCIAANTHSLDISAGNTKQY